MNTYNNVIYVNQSEAAALLGVSIATFRRVHLFAAGFPSAHHPTGARSLWRLDDIQAYQRTSATRTTPALARFIVAEHTAI
jgi:hypothetical protein